MSCKARQRLKLRKPTEQSKKLQKEKNNATNKEYFAIAGESVDVDGTQPVVTCRSTDVTGIDTSDTIVIDAVTYNIVNIQPDGTGMTVLILQEQ